MSWGVSSTLPQINVTFKLSSLAKDAALSMATCEKSIPVTLAPNRAKDRVSCPK